MMLGVHVGAVNPEPDGRSGNIGALINYLHCFGGSLL